MDKCKEDLQRQLIKCCNIINKGYTSIQTTRLSWLNNFCLEFFKFSQSLHIFLSQLSEEQKCNGSDHVEIIYLCLTQVVTCIRHMENTINVEEVQGVTIPASRQHFLDRIHWCLGRLHSCFKNLIVHEVKKAKQQEERSFVELMDRVLDILSLYSSYKEESLSSTKQKCVNGAENHTQTLFDSQEIRSIVDIILGHALAFANVALKQDKRALSALCQKVLRECMTFQEECTAGILNECNRKLKAASLENALYRLEDYINEALLRLVYNCFLDFNKFSIDKLRHVIRERGAEDPELDELIADFDVNVDRVTQIGIFAIAFAPNGRIKTILRSCLASFESLDSCIIPALQIKGTSDIFAKLLEQHFNEEFIIFKNSIQEIIDSHAFASSYFELLTETINQNDKTYNKTSLEDIIKMAEFLYEHFQLPVNYKQLQFSKEANRLELFKKFYLILQECQAVLKCNTSLFKPQRVLKRFKILRSILRKLIDKIGDKTLNGDGNKSELLLMSDELSDSQQMFASIGISPSIRSILYNNSTTKQNRRNERLSNDSLKPNYSKLSTTPLVVNSQDNNKTNTTKSAPPPTRDRYIGVAKNLAAGPTQRSSLRRKESLRTALFKRQKSCETEQLYNAYKNNSDSLQISEILNQLTDLSSNLSKHSVNKNILSN